MLNAYLSPGTGVIAQRNPAGLIVVFKNGRVVFQFDRHGEFQAMTLELYGPPHFRARIASNHIGFPAAHATYRLRRADSVDEGACCLR